MKYGAGFVEGVLLGIKECKELSEVGILDFSRRQEFYEGLLVITDRGDKKHNESLLKEHKNIEEIKYLGGVLQGLRICKEMWAKDQMSHESIYENEVYYTELLETAKEL